MPFYAKLILNPWQASFKRKTLSLLTTTSSILLLSACTSSQVKTNSVEDQLLLSKIKKTTIAAHKNVDITDDSLQTAIEKEAFYPNLWDELKTRFYLAHQHYGKYDDLISFYGKRKTHLEKVSERAQPYLYYVFNEVKKRGMPYEIALLPVVESGYRPHARSHQKAVGLWQFIPSTADLFALDQNWWYDGRKDVVKSTQAALDYLEKLYKLNHNDWLLALASYNAGLGNVYRAEKKFRKANPQIQNIEEYQADFWELQTYLPRETQAYVPKLLAVAHMVEFANLFELELAPVDNNPVFKAVKLEKQVALNQVAELANVPQQTFLALNPAYKQPTTPPKGSYNLLIPVEQAPEFEHKLASNSRLFDIQWQKHKIKSGDSLSVIAQRYKTSAKAIKKLNGMRNSKIRAGKTLLIPIPAEHAIQLASNSSSTNSSSRSRSNYMHESSQNTLNSSDLIATWHEVKAGDSLWQLAKDNNVRSRQIAEWNNIKTSTPLKLGQKLKIYKKPSGNKLVHQLKSGENLWVLARKYGVSTADLAKWNNIDKNKTLHPGQKLVVWTQNKQNLVSSTFKYTVKTGDNLWNIAKANNISAKELASHNKIKMNTLLKPGQVLTIPTNS